MFHGSRYATTRMQTIVKEDNAIKAKLRRLMEPKADGTLKVPQWLHDQWRTCDHLQMARQFQSCNFEKAPSLQSVMLMHEVNPIEPPRACRSYP